MKGPWKFIVLLLVLVLLAVSNPSREKHQAAIGEKVGREVALPGASAVGKAFSGLYDYRDYVFFSITRFDNKVRSIGAAGVVITLD